MPENGRRALLLGVLLVVSARCSEIVEEPAEGPEQLARQLFDLARHDEPSAEELERLVEIAPGRRTRTALLEALDLLGRLPPPRVEAIVPLAGLDRVAVDLIIEGPEGGSSRCSVQLGKSTGEWKVLWFAGPGFSWPAYSTMGNGLATRPSPGDDAVR